MPICVCVYAPISSTYISDSHLKPLPLPCASINFMPVKEMIMETKIVSRESIKPSSPTPNHLRTFKLSLLDQLIPAPYAPIVLFYPNHNLADHLKLHEKLALLKQSLSKTLTRFYPLAGKIKDDLSIECNDEGAYYIEAEVNCHLSEFLNNLDLQVIHQFLPCESGLNGSSSGTLVTSIQVNVFECGGIAIGLCISHKILDGSALSIFLKGWATTAGDSEEVVYPNFSASSLFPTNDLWLRDSSIVMWGSLFRKGKGVTRRFVFDASAIATLKAKSTSSSLQNPTRVEVVSACIWKCAKSACEEISGCKRTSLMTHIVNLRRRAIPTLSDNSMGNLIWLASAQSKDNDELGFQGLVGQVREAISKINGDYVKKLRGDEGCDVMCKSIKKIKETGSRQEVDFFGFTSWCKFGFYDVDIGWGKPIWVSGVGSSGNVFMNLIILMDTRCGGGIEAWVTLDEKEMNILEHDMELQELALLDPSPLKLGIY